MNDVFVTGDQVGEYLVVKKMGEGSTCQVYRALDTVLHRYVAIKAVLHCFEDMFAEEAFIEEGRFLAQLRHPNIVPIYAVGCAEHFPWMALAYIEGESLDMLTRPLLPDEINRFVDQATSALACAAKADIVHLDVKPSNFLLDRNGQFLLADFGIARRISDSESGIPKGEAVQGTPAFASPEHFLHTKLDIRTDIYSLGATLFQLLTGRPPFIAETAEDMGLMHVETPLPVNVLVDFRVQEQLRVTIAKMMEKKPEDRFQSYEELRDALGLETFRAPKIIETTQIKIEGRRYLPRSGGSSSDLFLMLPEELAALRDDLSRPGKMFSREEYLSAFAARRNLLRLNALAPLLKHLQFRSSDAADNILTAANNSLIYKESLRRMGRFMANQVDGDSESEQSLLDYIGEDRAFKMGVVAAALNRNWQGEVKLNHHNFWENGIYAGLLANLMADMLGYDLRGMEFLCGLVHSIGRLVFMEMYPRKTIALWIKAYLHHDITEDLERKYFGLTANEMGARWLALHKFDPLICHVVYHQNSPERCYKSLSKTTKQGLFVKHRPYLKNEVQTLAHVTKSAVSLSKELRLGFDGCAFLEKSAWVDQKSTRLIFLNRPDRSVTFEDFSKFFMKACIHLPELPLLELTSAKLALERDYLDKESHITAR